MKTLITNIVKSVYQFFETLPFLGKIFQKNKVVFSSIAFSILYPELRKYWSKRIDDVMSSPDNKFIPRVPNAGKIIDGMIIMHNGIRIHPGSYYGEGNRRLLCQNKGVHEPQEERVFMEVLKQIPPNATMIELGSFWSFYSMWFHKEIKNPKCYMVEPVKYNLLFGKKNFELNNMNGIFIHGFIGDKSSITNDGIPIVCVDDLAEKYNINHINILHSDVQSYELQMLNGAKKMLTRKQIDFIFISTHSDQLHYDCIEFLRKINYKILTDINLKETCSVDGLIVASLPSMEISLSTNMAK